jgi:Protein of unknown function (DUF1592)/Protein of unknown function (DUF1588)/Protein of unknown function (DUF1595)/Protein of unknown function (DUF1585)/Protein of unknown function (DUF1587)
LGGRDESAIASIGTTAYLRRLPGTGFEDPCVRTTHSTPTKRLLVAGLLWTTIIGGGGCANSSPAVEVEPGPIALRRLTAQQLTRTIRDVLGEHITVPRRIDPDDRRAGLIAVGASFASVTPSGFEKYEAAATAVAEQALDPEHRDDLVRCQPASATSGDTECARVFIDRVGRQLFRRSLTMEETEARVGIANQAASALNDFYAGLELALTSLLTSPEFLFRVEEAEASSNDPSTMRLTSVSMASRLSYFLWNTTPDDELLAAAENGDLVDEDRLAEEVERLLASPKLEAGIRSFFSDLYDFKQFDDGLVRKDAELFPAYSQTLAEEAKEQTLRTIVAHLTAEKDFRDLFTTSESFMTRTLGVIYRVPVPTPNGWEPYVFPEEARRVGLLSHVSFNALYSHPGRSSATLRGKFVREVLLCQDIPTPPANIDFSIVENTTGELRTARERLERHVTNDACAGCHSLMDPIGLALESFDAIGMLRDEENGAVIDTSGELEGVSYGDPSGMGGALRDHAALGPCLVRNLYRYAVGRNPDSGEEPLLRYLSERFGANEYRVTELLREIVLSEGFRATSGPREAQGSGDES